MQQATSNRRNSQSRPALLAVGLLAVIYLGTIGFRPLFVEDELRYAEIPREMLASGDWIVPRLQGLRYFEKPPLGYWTTALSIAAFGEIPFAVRLPETLATLLAGLITFVFMVRRGASLGTALLAALILLSTSLVALVGTFAILDPQLMACLTGTFAAYFAAVSAGDARLRTRWLVLAGVFAGLAFLAKGFLALALPGLVIVPFMFWERRARELFATAWTPLLSAVLVVLPWGLLVHRAEPDFWRYFFWVEHVQRFLGEEAQHPEPTWYLAALLPLLTFPWLFLAPAALRGLRSLRDSDPSDTPGDGVDRRLVRYLALWALLPFLFFSASRGKLATYILPCFPPFAMLLALGLRRELFEWRAARIRAGARVAATLIGASAVGVVVAQAVSWEALPFAPSEWSKAAALAAALASCAGLLWAGGGGATSAARLHLVGLAFAPLMLVAPWLTPRSRAAQVDPSAFLLERRDVELAPDVALLIDARLAHAVGWYLHRTDAYLTATGELGFEDARERDLTRGDPLHRFLDENLGVRPLSYLARLKREHLVADRMPAWARREVHGPYVLWHVPVRPEPDRAPPP